MKYSQCYIRFLSKVGVDSNSNRTINKGIPNGKGIFDVSFKDEAGEVSGCLGPNTIRQLLGFMNPSKGYSTRTIDDSFNLLFIVIN